MARTAVALLPFVLLAWGGLSSGGTVGPLVAVLPLPFVFVGFTHRPGAAIATAPFGVVALAIAARGDWGHPFAGTLLIALPMSVIAGEAIAQLVLRQRQAEQHIGRLLHAVRVLGRVSDEREGARLVATLASELVGADAVAVMLADQTGSRRYLNRAWSGHPAFADAMPLLVDGDRDAEFLRSGSTKFLADASRSEALRKSPASAVVRAAAFVPLPSDHGDAIGVILALWATPRRVLPAPARQAAELLSQEAGRMFARLRTTAALTHDASTDPLTDLANRRTFARALSTLQPGDAIVMVDLDHFKSVNDRFGHEVGDQTLRELARCLRHVSRQVDTVARYGGEEFTLVLAEAGEAGARSAMKRVRRAWSALEPLTSFSAGIAVHEARESALDTVRRADAALYHAKETGRNRDVIAAEEIVLA